MESNGIKWDQMGSDENGSNEMKWLTLMGIVKRHLNGVDGQPTNQQIVHQKKSENEARDEPHAERAINHFCIQTVRPIRNRLAAEAMQPNAIRKPATVHQLRPHKVIVVFAAD